MNWISFFFFILAILWNPLHSLFAVNSVIFVSLKKSLKFIKKNNQTSKIWLTDFYKKARSFIDQSNITSIDLSSLHSFFNNKRGATREIIFLLSFQNLCVDMHAQKMKFRRNCSLGCHRVVCICVNIMYKLKRSLNDQTGNLAISNYDKYHLLVILQFIG